MLMSGCNHLDLIWLSELNMALIYVRGDVPRDFVAAAIILKGDDGTDLFIPYDGYVDGAPIGFSVSRSGTYSVTVLGFVAAREPVELAVWTLDEELSPARSLSKRQSEAFDISVMGFGERSLEWQGERIEEIGFNSLEYSIKGEVEYSELLNSYLVDMRQIDDEVFTAFYVTGVPHQNLDDEGGGVAGSLDDFNGQASAGEADGLEEMEAVRPVSVGPALHLRPLHHFHFGLNVRCLGVDTVLDDENQPIYGDYNEAASPFESAALLKRHGGSSFRQIPEFVLGAGMAREQVDFVLRNGFHIHWRRQLETRSSNVSGGVSSAVSSGFASGMTSGMTVSMGSGNSGAASGRTLTGNDGRACFSLEPLVERNHLLQHQGSSYFRFAHSNAIIGDVVGLVFASEDASIDINVQMFDEPVGEVNSERMALFVFMGDSFVPLTKEILDLPENLGITVRLEEHIQNALLGYRTSDVLESERAGCARGLLERDKLLNECLQTETLLSIAAKGPYGPELMVYRDHLLRAAHSNEMAGWLKDIEAPSPGGRRGRLIDSLRFETFCKAPELAHALVFNETFRSKFQGKPIDPHSINMPVLEYLMTMLFSDQVIDWAMRLKGESQAILWHLVLKRPEMVERLFELKMEPDIALNPFDDQVLDHVLSALNDSSHIDVAMIEKKVIPVFVALRDEEKVRNLKDFAHALKHGAEGKALSLGELSVCLAAVETASKQWDLWRDEAIEIFSGLIAPLALEIGRFEEGDDFSAADDLSELRNSTGHLVERLVKELSASPELLRRGGEFLHRVESSALLEELSGKLDLALKYHRDLEVGVDELFGHFNISQDDLTLLAKIDQGAWPDMEAFPASFAAPLMEKITAKSAEFEAQIDAFAGKVHPGDKLFHQTLRHALDILEQALPWLVWLEMGSFYEKRVADMQKRLKNNILKVNPASAKLRRSKSLSEAVRGVVMAERRGPAGWPDLSQSLDVIEQELPI